MYKSLSQIGAVSASTTDDTKYSCLSVPSPDPSKWNDFYGSESPLPFYNREYYSTPSSSSSADEGASPNGFCKKLYPFPSVNNNIPEVVEERGGRNGLSHLPPLPAPRDPNSTNFYASELYSPPSRPSIPEGRTPLQHLRGVSKPPESSTLLPVLDCRFNMREICKQCILLEDHLSHDSKRCHDCCIKHFLALEGLSEEAITLDKQGSFSQSLHGIPEKIRYIQRLWYTDPDGNSHEASQMLREIRKQFMQNTFDVVFDDSSSSSSSGCTGGVCKIKK